MKGAYIIIAGKVEGFSYKDAWHIRIDDEVNIAPTIESLRHDGYKIFVVTKVIDRIDDFITEVAE